MPKFAVSETSGMTEPDSRSILYIDANPFIYAIEGDDSAAKPIMELLAFLKQRPGMGTTSELTLAEVLPKAPRLRHRQYLDLIMWSGIFELQPVTRSVLLETVRYRRYVASRRSRVSRTMPKLPDAIHVVTTLQAKCRFFLSADTSLRPPTNLTLIKPDKPGIFAAMQKLA